MSGAYKARPWGEDSPLFYGIVVDLDRKSPFGGRYAGADYERGEEAVWWVFEPF